MNGNRFIKATISMTLVLLLLIGALTIVVDPLFQYHKPWFGLKPSFINERYQNAGVAKNFDFDNVIIGSSMSENFRISDVNDIFGGDTVKLSLSGSGCLDWTYELRILKERKPKNCLLNIDSAVFDHSVNKLKHELPVFLYDTNPFNDVEYLYNFTILKKFLRQEIADNINNTVSDYDSVYAWDKSHAIGREMVLEAYERPENTTEEIGTTDYVENVIGNLNLLAPYIESMPNTQFTFFVSPFSMLFWDGESRKNTVQRHKEGFLKACEILTSYDNVTLYMWTDDHMFEIMSDLDNYLDKIHYGGEVSKEILYRIKAGDGIITKSNYVSKVDQLFQYIETFDYESLFY